MPNCDQESNNMHLLDLALRLRWSSLLERAALFPTEIVDQDEAGLTVFHWACANDAPSDVVRTLLEYDQSENEGRGIKVVDRQGITALMVASSNGEQSLELIELLLRIAPELVTVQDHDGWTALHYISCLSDQQLVFCRSAAETMLKVDRNLARIRNRRVETALDLACRNFSPYIENYVQSGNLHPDLLNLWVIASAFIEGGSAICLRSILEIPECPLLLIEASVQHFSESLTELDHTGNTPLHHAISRRATSGTIQSILRVNTATARIQNADGELPLALADRNRLKWSDDLRTLVEAYPAAVETLHMPDALYSYVFSRCSNEANTIFELLRSKPSIVRQRH
jgi:ankyrin repeat protein